MGDGPLCSKHLTPLDTERPCWICGGDGEIQDYDSPVVRFEECWNCGGSGEGGLDCSLCIDEDADELTGDKTP